jgi:hypothetical protein
VDFPPLATCRFQEFRSGMGIPVRITYGAPRFKLDYNLRHKIGELAPDGHMLKINDRDRFQLLYTRKLDELGVDRAVHLLRGILLTERADPGTRLVLLCFDDLTKPGMWCHRTMVATWWTFRTGEAVPEYAGLPARGEFTPGDATLF